MAESEQESKVNETAALCRGPLEFTTSETIGRLALALSKAQGEMTAAEMDGQNPQFHSRYSTLASIIEAARPLSRHALSYAQLPTTVEGKLILVTLLMHESGEWLRGQMPINPSERLSRSGEQILTGPQQMGVALTYARRYSLSCVLGIAGDDDTDGNDPGASKPMQAQAKPQARPPAPAARSGPATPPKAAVVPGEAPPEMDLDAAFEEEHPKITPEQEAFIREREKDKLIGQIVGSETEPGLLFEAGRTAEQLTAWLASEHGGTTLHGLGMADLQALTKSLQKAAKDKAP